MTNGNPNCTLCPLHKSAISVCVGGSGGGAPGVLVVGQNPGGEEDMAGTPFIGRSGKLLRGMLADAGFSENDYRLTNAVRCATPNNAAPGTENIDACRTYLKEEIYEYQPKLIVALGDTALRSLCRKTGISSARGNLQPLHEMFGYSGCEVLATYHPAYVLRRPIARSTVVADLRKARDYGAGEDVLPWGFWDGRLPESLHYAYDIETYDEEGAITENPTQVAIAYDGGVLVSRTRDDIKPMLDAMMNTKSLVISHNGLAFDDPRSGAKTTFDTMYLAYLLDENQPLGLESLCVKYLGIHGWKESRGDALLGSAELAEYNARDSYYTLQLYYVLRNLLGSRINVYNYILLPARLALDDMQRNGIYINQGAVAGAKETLIEEQSAAKAWLTAKGVANPNSTRQVAEALLLDGCVLGRTASGQYCVDSQTLRSLDSEIASKVLEYRRPSKGLGTYIRPYEAVLRVRPELSLLRTVVGRTSARNPNTQNLPRRFHDFLGAEEGMNFVEADYNALHFRLAGWQAQEQVILDRYKQDPFWDPHRWFAAHLFGVPESEVTPWQRQIAKSANFGLVYCGTPETLREYMARTSDLNILLPECMRIYKEWHQAFPRFTPWYREVWTELKENGFVVSPTGRRRNYGDVSLLKGQAWVDASREAVNFKVLGFETDLGMRAVVKLHELYPAGINYFCHDSIGVEVPKKDTEKLMKDMEFAMTQYAPQSLERLFGVKVDVPLTIEFNTTYGRD